MAGLVPAKKGSSAQNMVGGGVNFFDPKRGYRIYLKALQVNFDKVGMAGVMPAKEGGHVHQCFPLYRCVKLRSN